MRSPVVALLLLASCNPPPPGIRPMAAPPDPDFSDTIRTIAAGYEAMFRIDDEFHWAPWLCRMPNPATPHFSGSGDASTHGQKLYSLFAKLRHSYTTRGPTQPVGQVLVKESWIPEETTERPAGQARWHPYAERDGKTYKAARKAGLYFMVKVDPSTPGTDQGWIYATMSAKGRLTSCGRVPSCMSCHETSASDRMLYGPE